MKPKSMVYDATAGNRTIYTTKNHPLILYGDIEPDLTIKPDQLIDCRKTGLEAKSKYLIIFDPPHEYGRTKNTALFTTPSRAMSNDKWPQHRRKSPPRYYGADKYKGKKDLLNFIYESQKEFNRILADSGALFLKWSNNRIDLEVILKIFKNWELILKIPVERTQNMATPTYWCLLMKKIDGLRARDLDQFGIVNKENKT